MELGTFGGELETFGVELETFRVAEVLREADFERWVGTERSGAECRPSAQQEPDGAPEQAKRRKLHAKRRKLHDNTSPSPNGG